VAPSGSGQSRIAEKLAGSSRTDFVGFGAAAFRAAAPLRREADFAAEVAIPRRGFGAALAFAGSAGTPCATATAAGAALVRGGAV